MADDKNEIYLGIKGRIYGPFDSNEINRLRSAGELEKYSYLWDSKVAQWRPIEPPPVSPTSGVKRDPNRVMEAVCHNSNYSMIAGLLRNISETGCDLVTSDSSESPQFGMKSSVLMNVLDPTTKKASNVKVRMSDVFRRDGQWVYRVEWDTPPCVI